MGGKSVSGAFVRAAALGLGAAVVGSAVWYGIVRATEREWGLIAIVVGLFVGFAVRKGAGGRGGWQYQALAMVLTYVSITGSNVPLVRLNILRGQESAMLAKTVRTRWRGRS